MRHVLIAVLVILVLLLAMRVFGEGVISREPAPTPVAQQEMIVSSPMRGLFSRSDMPGGMPMVKVGDHLKSGAVLGMVDNMPIRAMFSGTLTDIMAADGEMVEAGQPLFRMRVP
jgi:biotin carboxyl carrier protein